MIKVNPRIPVTGQSFKEFSSRPQGVGSRQHEPAAFREWKGSESESFLADLGNNFEK